MGCDFRFCLDTCLRGYDGRAWVYDPPASRCAGHPPCIPPQRGGGLVFASQKGEERSVPFVLTDISPVNGGNQHPSNHGSDDKDAPSPVPSGFRLPPE